mmetsp:Transcript_10665/g.31662  ORF Transcript_10665/g.31662 Transcript_10665/m.31662 type:complete len:206 (+) Transcript_10665:50-667(+)
MLSRAALALRARALRRQLRRRRRRRRLHGRALLRLFGLALGVLEDAHGDPLGHLDLDAQEIDHIPLVVPQRGDEEVVPERRAVDLVVQQHDLHVPSRLDGVPDFGYGPRVRSGTLEEPTIPPQDLLELVAREREEAATREDDRVVRERRIGDHEASTSMFQGLQQPVVVLVDHARVRAARQVRVRRLALRTGLAPLEPRRGFRFA